MLNGKDVLSKDFHQFKIIVAMYRYVGYIDICNIIRWVHPIIMEDTDEVHIPKQGVYNTFIVHVKTFMDPVER